MADYFCRLSTVLHVGAANVPRALEIYQALARELEERSDDIGFGASQDAENDGALWLLSTENARPDDVIAFVLSCAEQLKLEGRWGFCWARSCSRPFVNAFSGGACLLDLSARQVLQQIECDHFLRAALDA
ncbi:hypothetical protein [Roseomonas chloroacetimidivorans]|uniref:hypothetical protein n=1 Tax=Roseomonas chloroacetimidivorans TaxID=1766656 RepID=UPI003C71716A